MPEDNPTLQAAIDAANDDVVIIAETGHHDKVISIGGERITIKAKDRPSINYWVF